MSDSISVTTNGTTTLYVHGPMSLTRQMDSSGAWTWLLPDGLGSVRGVVNVNNMPLDVRQFTPYGEPISLMGSTASLYGFTGEQTDPNGLVHLRARNYLPELGVFPSLDMVMGANRYGYVAGDPVNRVDPSGKFGIDLNRPNVRIIPKFVTPGTTKPPTKPPVTQIQNAIVPGRTGGPQQPDPKPYPVKPPINPNTKGRRGGPQQPDNITSLSDVIKPQGSIPQDHCATGCAYYHDPSIDIDSWQWCYDKCKKIGHVETGMTVIHPKWNPASGVPDYTGCFTSFSASDTEIYLRALTSCVNSMINNSCERKNTCYDRCRCEEAKKVLIVPDSEHDAFCKLKCDMPDPFGRIRQERQTLALICFIVGGIGSLVVAAAAAATVTVAAPEAAPVTVPATVAKSAEIAAGVGALCGGTLTLTEK